jgi:hypothetical protein
MDLFPVAVLGSRNDYFLCMQLQNFSVLDSRLGVVHKVPLCYRHCLPPTLMQSVHNVKALKTLIQHLAQT